MYTYHTHTNFSCDCHVPMREMCRAALEAGLVELGISDHFDIHPEYDCPGYLRPDEWWETFRRCRDEFGPQGLTLKAGIEIGEPHRYRAQAEDILARYEWDYALGSLHWLGNDLIFERDFFRRTPPEEVYTRYFTELERMVRVGGFDILAHMTIVKRRGYDIYGHYAEREWEPLIRPVLQACIDTGIIPEINTVTLRRPVKEATPSAEVLGWYYEMGGRRLALGTDAHEAENVAHGLDQAVEMARQVGFTRLTTFTRRRPGWLDLP
jgi:histidinol-phosphatase (PHP family)